MSACKGLHNMFARILYHANAQEAVVPDLNVNTMVGHCMVHHDEDARTRAV